MQVHTLLGPPTLSDIAFLATLPDYGKVSFHPDAGTGVLGALSGAPREAVLLCAALLRFTATDRITAQAALQQHPWFGATIAAMEKGGNEFVQP